MLKGGVGVGGVIPPVYSTQLYWAFGVTLVSFTNNALSGTILLQSVVS